MQETEEMQFDPWARKIPWRRKWQPTPVFLPGQSHGQRSLAGNSLWGRREVGHNYTHTLPIFQVSYNIPVAVTILKYHLWASLLQNRIAVDWPLNSIGLKCTGPHKWSTQIFFSIIIRGLHLAVCWIHGGIVDVESPRLTINDSYVRGLLLQPLI